MKRIRSPPKAFNALLKTLEEPPEHVVFLLATTEVHQFPGTILSRCQHFALHALTYAEILKQLEKICAGEKIIADAEALAVLAESGQGSLRDAQSRLEQAIAAFGERLEGPTLRRFLGEAPATLVEDVFRAVKEQKRERMLAVVESLVEDGYQLPHFCTQLVRTVRNLLVVQLSGPDQRLLESSEEESQRLVELAEGFTQESLMRCLDILLRVAPTVALQHGTALSDGTRAAQACRRGSVGGDRGSIGSQRGESLDCAERRESGASCPKWSIVAELKPFRRRDSLASGGIANR